MRIKSDRRRKCYNKRKSSRAEKERKLAAAAAQAGVNSLNQQNHQLTQQQLQQLQLQQQQAQQQQLQQQPLTPLSAKMPIRANGQPPQLQFGPQQQQQQPFPQPQQSIDDRVISMTPMQMQMAAANNVNNNNNNNNKLQVRDMSLELIKIGYVSHTMPDEVPPPFYGLADLQSTIRVFEDEIYVQDLHSKNNSLKKCIEDLYSPNVNMTHSLMYTRVPLSPDQKLSVDLTTDRMIAYVVCMLDMSGFLALNSQSISDDSFSRLIQMKSITKLYLGENIIYKKVEPTTGYIVPGTTKAKINIPLQTKYWAGAINDFSNGAIDETHFENLRIVHSLIPDDDMVKLRIEKDHPIASFIWEFFANTIPGYVPHSVVVWKDIPIVDRAATYWQQQQVQQQQQRNLMMANNKRFSFAEPPTKSARSVSEHFGGPGGRPVPVKTPVRGLGRGHKRTRSRSLNELDHLQHMQKPHSLLQQLQANRSVDTFDMNMNMMNGMTDSVQFGWWWRNT
ncbi:unnamed protein product [Ambrosiozyma monospora]|uniref:Unnamed protein product n=1 Tax=Ambrosiozyma monospora TaxID=43982 RepID=A0ACB5TKG8_AMBMO|nr:unnamed protein product [Ambrosiozyma monospora]